MFQVIWFTLALLLFQQSGELKRFESSRPLMGVEFTIVVYAEDSLTAAASVEAAFGEIASVNQALSDYLDDSEINRLCRSGPHEEWVSVSKVVYDTIRLSRSIYNSSNGAFDITVGPASRLWRKARREKRLPTEEEVTEAKGSIGMELVKTGAIEGGLGQIKLAKSGMQLDFGGIGKGLAADLALLKLRKMGIHSALINASGDILAGDPPPGKDGWTVQIPSEDPGEPIAIRVSNQAIATSGDVFQYLEIDGVRHSHIVDPKTARAVTVPRIVTIVSESAAQADAIASALSVMGKSGFELELEIGFEAQIIEADQKDLSNFQVWKTSSFPDEVDLKTPRSKELGKVKANR